MKLGARASVLVFCLCLASAGAVAAEGPTPTLEQRVAGLEAYLTNGDPAATLSSGQGKQGAMAKTASVGIAGPGHNAWMMISAALVLFMTLPGLALFYGGLVRSKNVLSIMAQCLGITGLVTILWWAAGYSLVFGQSFHSPILGGLEFTFLQGVTSAPNTTYAYWVSQNVFSMFQLMFAIITPVVLIGAVAERMKFSAVLFFTGAWMFVVYFPLAHMVWGSNGWMNGVWNPNAAIRSIDFAGGLWWKWLQGGRLWPPVSSSENALGLIRKPCLRTAWCFVWWARDYFGSDGTASTQGRLSRQMGLPPTHSLPPPLRLAWPLSFGR